MNKYIKWFIVILLCFCVDSLITYFVPFDFSKEINSYIPCMGLMMFAILSLHERETNFIFTLLVGLYYAIIYANSLAIYILVYWFITYYAKKYHFYVRETYFSSTLFLVSTVFIQEGMVYLLMSGTGLTRIMFEVYLTSRLLPTLVLNLGLSLPVYLIYHMFLDEGDQHEYQY